MNRVPTEKQYERLRSLSVGVAGLSFLKRDTEPLLRRGWVTAEWDGKYYQWVEITADGLRAVADGIDRYGLPRVKEGYIRKKVCADCGGKRFVCHACGSGTYRFEQEKIERRSLANANNGGGE